MEHAELIEGRRRQYTSFANVQHVTTPGALIEEAVDALESAAADHAVLDGLRREERHLHHDPSTNFTCGCWLAAVVATLPGLHNVAQTRSAR